MSPLALALSGSLALVGAAGLGAVGVAYSRRANAGEGTGDLRLFALLWHGTGVALLADGALTFLVLTTDAPLGVVVAIMSARLLGPIVALFGFAGYLTVVYFGTRRFLIPLAATLGLVYVATLGVAQAFGPGGVEAQTWRGWYVFEHVPHGAAYTFADAVNFLPPLLLTVAFARLFAHTEEPLARWRVALLSPSLAAWFAGQYFGFLDFQWSGFALLEGILAVGLVACARLALRPPAWALRRLQRAPWTAPRGLASAPQSRKSREA